MINGSLVNMLKVEEPFYNAETICDVYINRLRVNNQFDKLKLVIINLKMA